ncbi:MAG: hypothetical protein K8F27_03580 [Sulfuricellaceae bacterium]|nr:hypothetical protein [Sulfuricellaceae bacterium]
MAHSQTAFMQRNQVPARQALQEAIESLRFKLTIDESYVPFEFAGYIPCTLDGEDAGFEIKFGEAPDRQAQIGGRDTAITLRSCFNKP